MKDEGFGSGSLLLSFLLGGVVGAGLALLVAPQSGEATRRKIKELADDIKDRTNDYINEAREKVGSVTDEGKGFYDEKKSLIKAAIDAGKEAYEKEKEKFAKG
ncbi:MAG: YtxH domain-containing protein [Nitrospirae bacterium]|nr:YtxH domain-containing protein [Nitrospirota bacterium]